MTRLEKAGIKRARRASRAVGAFSSYGAQNATGGMPASAKGKAVSRFVRFWPVGTGPDDAVSAVSVR